MVNKDNDPRNKGGYAKAKAAKEAGEEGVKLVFKMHEGNREDAEKARDALVKKFGKDRAATIAESVIKANGGGGLDRVSRMFKRR